MRSICPVTWWIFFLSPSPTPHFWTSSIEEQTECQGVKDLNLSIVANYLANPFPNIYTEESIPSSLAESQNESASVSSASQSETSPCPSTTQAERICIPMSCSSGEIFPAPDAAARPLPMPTVSAATACASPGVPYGPSCPLATTPNVGLCSSGVSSQALPLQPHTSPSSPAPTFQPFFLTGTFPYNIQGKEVLCLIVLLQLLGEKWSYHFTSDSSRIEAEMLYSVAKSALNFLLLSYVKCLLHCILTMAILCKTMERSVHVTWTCKFCTTFASNAAPIVW